LNQGIPLFEDDEAGLFLQLLEERDILSVDEYGRIEPSLKYYEDKLGNFEKNPHNFYDLQGNHNLGIGIKKIFSNAPEGSIVLFEHFNGGEGLFVGQKEKYDTWNVMYMIPTLWYANSRLIVEKMKDMFPNRTNWERELRHNVEMFKDLYRILYLQYEKEANRLDEALWPRDGIIFYDNPYMQSIGQIFSQEEGVEWWAKLTSQSMATLARKWKLIYFEDFLFNRFMNWDRNPLEEKR